MTIEDLRNLVADYRDVVMSQLKISGDGAIIKECSKKLRISEKVIEAIDAGIIEIKSIGGKN